MKLLKTEPLLSTASSTIFSKNKQAPRHSMWTKLLAQVLHNEAPRGGGWLNETTTFSERDANQVSVESRIDDIEGVRIRFAGIRSLSLLAFLSPPLRPPRRVSVLRAVHLADLGDMKNDTFCLEDASDDLHWISQDLLLDKALGPLSPQDLAPTIILLEDDQLRKYLKTFIA